MSCDARLDNDLLTAQNEVLHVARPVIPVFACGKRHEGSSTVSSFDVRMWLTDWAGFKSKPEFTN